MSFGSILQGVLAGVTAVLTAVAAGMTGGLALVAIGVVAGALVGIASHAMTPQMPKIQSPDNSVSLGTTTDPKTVLPVVFGQTRVGTICVYKGLAHDNHTKLVSIYAVSEGEIDSFQQLYMDNKKIFAFDERVEMRDEIVNNGYIRNEYRGVLEIEFRTGKNPNTCLELAKQYLTDEEWNDNYRGNGIATICIVITRDKDALTDGCDIIQPNSQVSVDITGTLIRNLSTGALEASANPVDQMYHYLTNEKYGLNVPVEQINIESFLAIREKVHALKFESHGACDPNASFKENLISLQQTFGGVLFETFGQLTLRMDEPDIAKMAFDEDSIVMGSIALKSGGSNGYYNVLNAKYRDPDTDYAEQMLRYPPKPEEDATVKKDGRIIAKDVEYRFISSKEQIDKLASIERNKAKITQTLSFSTTEAFTLQVWDVISVSIDELNLKNSLWRIISIERTIDSGMSGVITINCAEYDSRVYTDMEFAYKPDDKPSTMPDSMSVIAPTNLQVKAIGQTFYGKNVQLTWECQEDWNRYGFNVEYRVSGSSDWVTIGKTSQKAFIINQLDASRSYDYRVCAFGIISRSAYVELVEQNPEVTYTLPTPKIRIGNVGAQLNHFTGTDLVIKWENQQHMLVDVNGVNVKFGELFDHYLIRVTNIKSGRSAEYRTRDHDQWTYTLDQNKFNGLSREIRVEVLAKGHNGVESAPATLTALNPQHSAIRSFNARGGFNNVFCEWASEHENDYAGTVIQYSATNDFTLAKSVTTNGLSHTSFELADGDYYLRAGHFDVFGIDDSIAWSEIVALHMKSTISWDDQDKADIEDLLNLQEQLDKTIADAIAGASQDADAKINKLHKQITTETGQTVDSAVTNLKQVIADGDKASATQIDQVKSEINGTIDSTVTSLKKTIADGDKASATKIEQVRTEFDGKIASVNQEAKAEVDKLKGTINSKYNLSVEADGRVAGIHMSATNDPAKPTKIIFTADKFAVAPQGGSSIVPFGVEGNKVYIDSAMIKNGSIGNAQIGNASIDTAKIKDGSITTAKIGNAQIDSAKIKDGSITNAKIANVIQSSNYVAGRTGWMINKNGSVEFGDAKVRGEIQATKGTLNNVIIENNCQIKGTLRVDNIEGDIIKFYSLGNGETIEIPATYFDRVVQIVTIATTHNSKWCRLWLNDEKFFETKKGGNDSSFMYWHSPSTILKANTPGILRYDSEDRYFKISVIVCKI
ncbi:phage tail tip protein [Proteus columbae]|uniref:phage tail tip fiber protein n=1 Tax=Proteus columbae TaxID=1987580 RepID=UPI00288B9BB1|nr:DUF1983 domain-containing protein [Proteus columbae]